MPCAGTSNAVKDVSKSPSSLCIHRSRTPTGALPLSPRSAKLTVMLRGALPIARLLNSTTACRVAGAADCSFLAHTSPPLPGSSVDDRHSGFAGSELASCSLLSSRGIHCWLVLRAQGLCTRPDCTVSAVTHMLEMTDISSLVSVRRKR